MSIRELIELWEKGQTTSDQMTLLKEYFRSQTQIPDDLKHYVIIFRGFEDLKDEQMNIEPVFRSSIKRRLSFSFVGLAASIAIVCGVYFSSEPYCYVNGQAVRGAKQALAAVETLSALNKLDNSTYSLSILDDCFEFSEYRMVKQLLSTKE